MRRITTAFALALILAGCGEQVPLITNERATTPGACILDLSQVVDVIADPTSGTPTNAATGEPLMWPKGYTARRALLEVEVLDPAGSVVLRTGARYSMCAADLFDGWVIGKVKPCPDCELGVFQKNLQ